MDNTDSDADRKKCLYNIEETEKFPDRKCETQNGPGFFYKYEIKKALQEILLTIEWGSDTIQYIKVLRFNA